LALKRILNVGAPALQKFHFQQAERMPLSTFFAEVIAYAGKHVRFELPIGHLKKALQNPVTVFESEALKKKE
jgi:hypothetical protein